MVLPEHSERISPVAPGGSFSRAVVGRCPVRVWGGLVEPATVAKVEAPLNGRVLWKGLPRVLRPRACSGSPYRINKRRTALESNRSQVPPRLELFRNRLARFTFKSVRSPPRPFQLVGRLDVGKRRMRRREVEFFILNARGEGGITGGKRPCLLPIVNADVSTLPAHS